MIRADITAQEEVDAMFENIQAEFSTLDVLVNCAGNFKGKDGPNNVEALEDRLNTFLVAQIRVTKAACELMEKGKVIFISSIHGKLGHGRPNVISYSAAKAGLESYMKNLAKALAPDILVNAIEPGRTLTPSWGEMTDNEMREQASGQLINRWIDPAEIADGVVFLAKNDAVCGEVLVIDGGMSMKVLG